MAEILKSWFSLLQKHYKDFLRQQLFDFKGQVPEGLTRKPGVYAIYAQGNTLYIGESGDLRKRVWTSHKSGRTNGDQFNRHLKGKMGLATEEERRRYAQDCEIRFLISDDAGDLSDLRTRKLVEGFLICVLNPRLNDS